MKRCDEETWVSKPVFPDREDRDRQVAGGWDAEEYLAFFLNWIDWKRDGSRIHNSQGLLGEGELRHSATLNPYPTRDSDIGKGPIKVFTYICSTLF